MLCEVCKKNTAKIHVTQIREKNKNTIHICPECAHEKGVSGPTINTAFSVEQLLGGLGEATPSEDPKITVHHTCPNCGLTYSAFKESGRFGCPTCYTTFTDQLRPLLAKVQKDTKHVGKIPHQGNILMTLKRKISESKMLLKEAVDEENFEEAANLRDKIREMEQELIQTETEQENDK